MKRQAREQFINDLLHQAEVLARADPSKPRQANLRRAISSAYYAVFHALIEQGTRKLFSDSAKSGQARYLTARSYQHSAMLQACRKYVSFRNEAIRGLFLGVQEGRLVALCHRFESLQEARHAADYDTLNDPTRAEALEKVSEAKEAIRILDDEHLTSSQAFQTFAALLLFGKSRGS